MKIGKKTPRRTTLSDQNQFYECRQSSNLDVTFILKLKTKQKQLNGSVFSPSVCDNRHFAIVNS